MIKESHYRFNNFKIWRVDALVVTLDVSRKRETKLNADTYGVSANVMKNGPPKQGLVATILIVTIVCLF